MSRPGRPQGGAKSEADKAAYWRMQYESTLGALADLCVEHTETVEAHAVLRAKVKELYVPLFWNDGEDALLFRSDVVDLIDEVLK